MTAAAWSVGTSWISIAAGPPDSVGKSATVEKPETYAAGMPATSATVTEAGIHNWKICKSRVDSNRDNRNITVVNRKRETHKSRDASNNREINKSTSIRQGHQQKPRCQK
jgi:hypothetical protein